MIINVHFLNGDPWWRSRVLDNARTVSAIFSDPNFISKVRAWPSFDYTSWLPHEIANLFENTPDVTIRVAFYRGWIWSKAIAYEKNGVVYFNTRKASRGAGGVSNIAHEIMHALGFSHRDNKPAGDENTVPWRIGQWAAEWPIGKLLQTMLAAVPTGLRKGTIGGVKINIGVREIV